MKDGVVLVHGGVSGTEKENPPLAAAVNAGLMADDVLDAVQAAVVVMEDDPALNAGYGATLTRAGTIELDAGIADGATGRCGGIANVSVKNPILLARALMERTPHVLLTGTGASSFAHEQGLPVLQDTSKRQRDRYERALADGTLGLDSFGSPDQVDTVGAVGFDGDRRLAAASSTGGVFGKLPGRVGDAPIFGAGFFADELVATVGTGVGEDFLRSVACFRVAQAVAKGATPQAACEEVIAMIGDDEPGTAGLLALDRKGRIGVAFRGASWAVEGPDGPIDAVPVG